jgi:PTS system D-glucosamine-specific IIC component
VEAKEKNNVGATVYGAFQKLGPSLMPAVAVIPLGGLLLAFGTMLSNTTFIQYLPFLGVGAIQAFAGILQTVGNLIINNLGVWFCLSVAFSFCDKDAVAAFSALFAYMTMHTCISNLLGITGELAATDWQYYTTTLGISTLNMGVFGGLLCGLMTVAVYKKFKDVKLPSALSFFQGKRAVPIMSIVCAIVMSIPVMLIWPRIQGLIVSLMDIGGDGEINIVFCAFLAFIIACLLPFGLHTLVYVVWAFQLGSYTSASGEVIHGLQNIFFAQMADGVPLTTTAMLTGNYTLAALLVGLACAFISEAKPQNKEKTRSLLSGGIFTVIMTGITEPISFTYLFMCPPLYLLTSFFSAVCVLIINAVQTNVGTGYCGGVMDFIIYGLLQQAHNWWLLPILCLVIGFAYYVLARFLIRTFHLMVPGQEEEEETVAAGNTNVPVIDGELAKKVLENLGGKENVTEIDACATRLRVAVKSIQGVRKENFTKLGATGTMVVGKNLQIVFGTKAVILSDQIKALMKGEQVSPVVFEESKEEVLVNEDMVAPLSGKLVGLKDIPDKVFAEGMMGTGFAIDPDDGMVYSPVNGVVDNVFPTKHAIGIVSDGGKEILIHMGIDTVKIGGAPFEIFVKNGEMVEAGQKLAKMDLKAIREDGYATIVPILFTNIPMYEAVLDKQGTVKAKETGFMHLEEKGE